MYASLFQLLLAILTSSAISVGMLAYGFRSRRIDGSRRWIFVVGGVIGCLMTVPVGFLSIGEIDREGSLLLVILCVIVLLASLILLRRGVRGRRVGDHPHCRRCGFDLFGRPETSHQCSECGANLDDSRAIVIGVRQRRTSLIFGSLFLMLVSLGVGVPVGWEATGNRIDWNRYKPDWWLVMQWDPSPRTLNSTASMEELFTRLSAGKLSDSARHSMMKRIVATGTPGGQWIPALLSSAEKRAVDESLLRSLVRMNCLVLITSEYEVPIGRDIPCTTSAHFFNQNATGQLTMRIVRDEINGIEIPFASCLVQSPAKNLIPFFQMDQGLLDPGPLWQRLAPESKPDGVILKWKREVEINVKFQNGNQTLTDSNTITATRDITAKDASLFASEETVAPWHITLRRAGEYAWIEIDPDDAFLEGKTVTGNATLTNAVRSFEQPAGRVTTDGSLASSLCFYANALRYADNLRVELVFQRSFVTNKNEDNVAVFATTVRIADPGRKLPDSE